MSAVPKRSGVQRPIYIRSDITCDCTLRHGRLYVFSGQGHVKSGITLTVEDGARVGIRNGRVRGLLLVYKNWVLENTSVPSEDNTMSQHEWREIHFFSGTQSNPYPFERALADVVQLHDWAQSCRHSADNSNGMLGRTDIACARQHGTLSFCLR
jgi:hypothetical protein